MESSIPLDLANNLINSSNKKNAVDKITDFFRENPLSSIAKSLDKSPDQKAYNKLLTDANDMFLSDNINDYVAAMCIISQEYILDKINTIEYEIADLTNSISEYIATMIEELERLNEVKTFPNLISLLLDMEEKMVDIIVKVAALQSRVFTQGNYSNRRIDGIKEQIYSVLKDNAKVRWALGLYDPNAHFNMDYKNFFKYIKQRVEELINEIKNLSDFPENFLTNINPIDIMYKNFSRLYGYVCKASKLVGNNTMNWRKGKLQELKSNTDGVSTNLYKALVIIDKYLHTNMVVDMEEDPRGTVLGRFLKDLKDFDFSPLQELLKTLGYLVSVVLKQAEILATTPFQTLAAELQARGLPSNFKKFFSREGFAAIRDGEWAKMMGFDKYLKFDVKAILIDLLRKKGDKIGIPLDKLPKIETLLTIASRFKDTQQNIKNTFKNLKGLMKANGFEELKADIPPEITESVLKMAGVSPMMAEAIKQADPAKMSKVLSNPKQLTESGAMAEKIGEMLAEASDNPELEITVTEKDSLERAKEIFEGDHIQECKRQLQAAEGVSSRETGMALDEYVTPMYDNAIKAIDNLTKAYDEGDVGLEEEADSSDVDPFSMQQTTTSTTTTSTSFSYEFNKDDELITEDLSLGKLHKLSMLYDTHLEMNIYKLEQMKKAGNSSSEIKAQGDIIVSYAKRLNSINKARDKAKAEFDILTSKGF